MQNLENKQYLSRSEAQKLLQISSPSSMQYYLMKFFIKPAKTEIRKGRNYNLYNLKDIQRLKEELCKNPKD